MDWEVEFYSDIINHAFTILDDDDDKFVWKCYKIIELMSFLKKSSNDLFKLVANNALILILSIFEDFDIDLGVSKSVDLDTLSKQEKEILIKTLKSEILT